MPIAKRLTGVSSLQSGVRRAEPIVWLSAGAVVFALLVLIGLLSLLAVRGLTHFWPQPLLLLQTTESGPQVQLGVILDRETGSSQDLEQVLLHRGGEGFFDSPLVWINDSTVFKRSLPGNALVIERESLGPIFGFLQSLRVDVQMTPMSELSLDAQLGVLRDAMRAESGASTS
ncbi:MAG: phosphate transport system permease protein, partial [Congregibacter sp.]